MDNIISDLDFLHVYFSDEFQKAGINILDSSNVTINKVKLWLKRLTIDQKKQLIELVKATNDSYQIKYNATKRDIKFRIGFLWTMLILLSVGISLTILFRISIYVDTPKFERETRETFLSYVIGFICLLLLIIRSLKNQIKFTNSRNKKIDSLNEKIKSNFNSFDITKVTENNIDNTTNTNQPNFSKAIVNFMNDYEEHVAKLKFGDFLRFSLIDQIKFFFSEQKNIVYKNPSNSISNSEKIEDFVNFIFDKKKILDEITLINKNITTYPRLHFVYIQNQVSLVNQFFELIYKNKIIDKNLLLNNSIFLIIKNKLKILIKYYDVTNTLILNQITNKINSLKTFENPDLIFDNYTILIELLYSDIDNDQKKDNYMSNINTIPSRFVIIGSFLDFYKDLTVSQIDSIIYSINSTINNINKLLNDYKQEIEQEFQDKKNSNYQLIVISISVILIIALQLKQYIFNIDDYEDIRSKDTIIDKSKNYKNVTISPDYINKASKVITDYVPKAVTKDVKDMLHKSKIAKNYIASKMPAIRDVKSIIPSEKDFSLLKKSGGATINNTLDIVDNSLKKFDEYTDLDEMKRSGMHLGEIGKIRDKLNNRGDIIMDFINYYSIWFFFSVVIITFWNRKRIENLINLSEYTINTDNIKLKLTEVISKLTDLKKLKQFMIEKTDDVYQDLINDTDSENTGLFSKYNYKIKSNDTNKTITNIIKSDNIYYVYNLNDVQNDLSYLIYLDFVDIMKSYEEHNFINIATDIPYPTTEIILNGVFLAISVLVVFLIMQRLNPVDLLTDVKDLSNCNNNKLIEVKKMIDEATRKFLRFKKKSVTGLTEIEQKEFSKLESLIEQLEEKQDEYAKENIINNHKCEDLIERYKNQDLSKAKIFMTISIFYTTMYLSFKIISSSY